MYNNYVNEEYSEVIDTSLYTDQLIRSEYEETQTILMDNCSQYGITATCFDTYENLLWVGNQLVSKYALLNNKVIYSTKYYKKYILFRAM